MACRRCGQCCVSVHLVIGGVVIADDKQDLELARWISYHGCEVMGVIQKDGASPVLGIKVPLACKHLEFDGNSGLCSCAIYDRRPKVCREHLCNAAKE